MAAAFDLDELMERMDQRRHPGGAFAHAAFGGIKGQLDIQGFGITAHKLADRQRDTGDRQIGEHGSAGKGQVGGIEHHRKRITIGVRIGVNALKRQLFRRLNLWGQGRGKGGQRVDHASPPIRVSQMR